MSNVALPQADVNTAVFSVLDAFPYPATIVDPTGRIVSINTLFALRFGLTVSECIGQDIFVLASTNLNPERLTFRREAGEDVLRTGKAFVFEERRGTEIHRTTINPYRSQAGDITHVLVTVLEVTEHRLFERNAPVDKASAQLALKLSRTGIWEVELESGRNFWSDTMWELYDLTPGEVEASTAVWERVVHPDDRNRAFQAFENAIRLEVELNFEFRVRYRDGSIHWRMARGLPLRDQAGRLTSYIGILVDITDRKQAEAELAKHRQHTDFALEKSHIGVWDLNLRTFRAMRTPEAARILGYHEHETDWSLNMFMRHVIPEEREETRALINSAIKDRKNYAFECRIRRVDGEIRWIAVNGIYHTDRIGNEDHILGILQDITERKLAEEEREQLQAQLLHSQKLELIGQLAGGIAHDFNNHLTSIIGNTELLLNQVNSSQPFVDKLQFIHQAALRSADLTRQLLAFARKQTVKPKVLDLNDEIEHLLPMISRLIGSDITIEFSPETRRSLISIDPSQLDQILTNLCINARDAIKGQGRIRLTTALLPVDSKASAEGHICQFPGNYVRLTVSDTGSGISLEALPHIFEPFFTTKELGKGSGLGLSTVYGIVKQSKGCIECQTEEGTGTTFSIYLPQHTEERAVRLRSDSRSGDTEGQLTILLVEDGTEVLKLVTNILEMNGFRVITASDAETAIEIPGHYPGRIDLLLADIRLPGMSGVELSLRLHEAYPEMKILFMSAYATGMIDFLSMNDQKVNFIPKPFTIKDLLSAIQKAMAAS